MKTIVVATDGSGSSRAALELALQPAGEVVAAVWCVSVEDSLARIGVDRESSHVAEAAAQAARERGLPARAVTCAGPTAERILAVADECGADLIVAGRRGHGIFTGAPLGSVSMTLVRHSRRPVLVVHADAA